MTSSSKILIAYLFLFLSQNNFSQNIQTQPERKDTSQTSILSIPLTEITNKLPDASAELRAIQKSMVTESKLEEEKEKLDTFLIAFEQFKRKMELSDTGNATHSTLNNQFYLWNRQKSKLTNFNEQLNLFRTNLYHQKKSVDLLFNVWDNTLKTIQEKNDLPENLVPMIRSFISEINLLQDSLNERNDKIFLGLEKVTQSQIIITEHLSDIQARLEKYTGGKLFDKGPSLFKLIKNPANGASQADGLSQTFKKLLTPFNDYVEMNPGRLLVTLLLFIVLTLLLMIFKKNLENSQTGKADKHIISSGLEFTRRPIITSFLIMLVFAFLIFAEAPMIFHSFLLILLIFPLMILLPALTLKKMDKYIYSLGFVFLLMIFVDLATSGLIHYLAMLAFAVILIFGLRQLIREQLMDSIFANKIFPKLFNNYFWLLEFLLILSIPAIFIGYFPFGKFLIEGIIWTLYSFLLLYAGYNIMAGFFELGMHSAFFQRFNMVRKYYGQISKWFTNVLIWITVISLIYLNLRIFHIDNPVIKAISSVWLAGFTIGNISLSLGKIVIFFLTLWISIRIGRFTRTLLEEDVFNQFKMKRGIPRTISVLIQYTLVTIGFLIAAAAAGFELKNLTIIFGALGVGIGFGLQDVINNFISGLILLFERPIQVGDTVEVSELKGIVKRIGIRSSMIRTYDGSEVIVPNGILISREVINWTLSDKKRRLELPVGVAYGSELRKVMEILKDCAVSHDEVLDHPEPLVFFTGFGNSSLDFRLLFWVNRFEEGLSTRTEVAVAIDDALKEAGITIPFPQMDVYIQGNEENSQKEKT